MRKKLEQYWRRPHETALVFINNQGTGSLSAVDHPS